MNELKHIDKLTNWLLLALAITSGIISYVGMLYVARDAGMGYWLSWLWPAITETAVVIFSLTLLKAKIRGYATWWLKIIIYSCAGMSSVFNVIHAPEQDWLSRAVWALPPIFLLASFETWIWQIEQDVKKENEPVPVKVVKSTKDKILEAIAMSPQATQKELAEIVSVTRVTISKYQNQLVSEGMIAKNGKEWVING